MIIQYIRTWRRRVILIYSWPFVAFLAISNPKKKSMSAKNPDGSTATPAASVEEAANPPPPPTITASVSCAIEFIISYYISFSSKFLDIVGILILFGACYICNNGEEYQEAEEAE